ncbi:MAG: calcium-binding protein, partial [Pseudomonadota bacterium]|nr:calcium-binding protein [Pseudomonadota bacterium]
AVIVNLDTRKATGGHASGDVLSGIDGITGSNFDDVLTGQGAGNQINGGRGNDVIDGLGGDDVLDGGGNNDTVNGGSGNDIVRGGFGRDILSGGAGADLIDGGNGRDLASYETSNAAVRIDLGGQERAFGGDATGDLLISIEDAIGSRFGDAIAGSAVANLLSGGDGNDILRGRAGNDTLNGDAGDDDLIGGAGNDQLDGGAGQDRAIFSGAFADFTVTVNADDSVTVVGQGADTLRDIETLVFDDQTVAVSSLPRVIVADSAANVLIGGDGDDILDGGNGADVVRGGAGDDELSGGKGADIVGGGAGDDVLSGGPGRDTFIFKEGFDRDIIRDFRQGRDSIELDLALFEDLGFAPSGQEVVDIFGTLNNAGKVLTFNFGDGDILKVRDTIGIDPTTFGDDFLFV